MSFARVLCLLGLYLCTTALRDELSSDGANSTYQTLRAGRFLPDWIGGMFQKLDGAEELSYTLVPIPHSGEVAQLFSFLQSDDCESALDTEVVDYTMRYAALAYSRNVKSMGYFAVLKQGDRPDVIEIQLHGTKDWANGAHAVIYLSPVAGGGILAVLCYKGSTLNLEDWLHNLYVWSPAKLDLMGVKDLVNPDSFVRKALIHWGFKVYKRSLDKVMREFSLLTPGVREVLEAWGAFGPDERRTCVLGNARKPSNDICTKLPPGALIICNAAGRQYNPATCHVSLYDWLYQGKFSGLYIIGHSLGGAMAQIAAAEIALHSEKQPFLATLGSPTAGNEGFMETLEEFVNADASRPNCTWSRVLPLGGYRFYNEGDAVTKIGYNALSGEHVGFEIPLQGRTMEWMCPLHIHLRYTFETRMLTGEWTPVTLKFPGLDYEPVGEGREDTGLQQNVLTVMNSGAVKVK